MIKDMSILALNEQETPQQNYSGIVHAQTKMNLLMKCILLHKSDSSAKNLEKFEKHSCNENKNED